MNQAMQRRFSGASAALLSSAKSAREGIPSSAERESRRALEFREKIREENQLRILGNAARQMSNLVKLNRYAEAAYRSQVLAGILRTWETQLEKSIIN